MWAHLERFLLGVFGWHCMGRSCGNPLCMLHRGLFSLGFQKKIQALWVMASVWRRVFISFLHLSGHFGSLSNVHPSAHARLSPRAGACVSVQTGWVRAHVSARMPLRSALVCSGPLAGNLSIEIRKKNSRQECLCLSQRGIYNGLQAALTSPSLSLSLVLSLSLATHTSKQLFIFVTSLLHL